MSESYKLPGSSYEELVKIIKAYATTKVGNPLSLEAVAQTAGMDKTIVSRNNGFLVQLGFISEGNKKAPTQPGSDLGRAYTLNMNEQIVSVWKTAINDDEFLTRMLSAIKIRNGMEKSSFINHILYSSGSSTNKNTRTGASTIIDIYKAANLVAEEDGKIIATQVDGSEEGNYITPEDVAEPAQMVSPKAETDKPPYVVTSSGTNVTININLNIGVDDLDDLPNKLVNLINAIKQEQD